MKRNMLRLTCTVFALTPIIVTAQSHALPEAVSTLSVEQARLDEQYNALLAVLPSPQARNTLRIAQEDWATFRSVLCVTAPIVTNESCLINKTRSRADILETYVATCTSADCTEHEFDAY